MNARILIQETTPTPAPEGEAAASNPLITFAPILLLIVLFYIMVLGPQRKKDKQRNEMLKQIKKNDQVLTQGGIYGIVQSVKDDEVALLIDEKRDVRIRVARSAVVAVTKVSGAADSERAETPREEARK